MPPDLQVEMLRAGGEPGGRIGQVFGMPCGSCSREGRFALRRRLSQAKYALIFLL